MQEIRRAFLVAWLIGCAPATVQMARTSGKGTFELGLEPGVQASYVEEELTAVPTANLAARYGVSDKLDLGARVGTGLYELQLKYMFTDPAATDEMAISIAPAGTLLAGGLPGVGGLYWSGRLPVLFGIPMGDGSELTFGPVGSALLLTAGAGSSRALALVGTVGGQVGYAARVADNLWLVPQLDFGVPVLAAAGARGNATAEVSAGYAVGFQLGLLFDTK